MKKIYFLAIAFISTISVNAQTSYTLTQANSEPIVGDSYISATLDTNGTVLPMSISGSGVTWNITGVTLDTTATNTYSTAASHSNSANYAGTNLVQTSPATTMFYKSSTGLFELLGVESTQFTLNYNAGNATMASYPMAFGYSNTDNTVGGTIDATTPFGAMNGTFTGTVTTTVDGSGTLDINTGASNFTNCIRVKSVQNLEFDLTTPLGQIAGTIDQVFYNYYHSSNKFPIFTVNYTHILAPTASIDQEQNQVSTLSTVVIGVKENKLNHVVFKAYPNPTSADVELFFTLSQEESYEVEIFNSFGQIVKSESLKNLQPGIHNPTLNTTNLANGIYTIKISGKNKQGVQKLVIQK